MNKLLYFFLFFNFIQGSFLEKFKGLSSIQKSLLIGLIGIVGNQYSKPRSIPGLRLIKENYKAEFDSAMWEKEEQKNRLWNMFMVEKIFFLMPRYIESCDIRRKIVPIIIDYGLDAGAHRINKIFEQINGIKRDNGNLLKEKITVLYEKELMMKENLSRYYPGEDINNNFNEDDLENCIINGIIKDKYDSIRKYQETKEISYRDEFYKTPNYRVWLLATRKNTALQFLKFFSLLAEFQLVACLLYYCIDDFIDTWKSIGDDDLN